MRGEPATPDRMWHRRTVLLVASGLVMIVVLAAGAWYVALRVGAADRIICVDPTPGHHVYRTYEADSGCVTREI